MTDRTDPDITTATSIDDHTATVVLWPDPSPLSDWWTSVLDPARPTSAPAARRCDTIDAGRTRPGVRRHRQG